MSNGREILAQRSKPQGHSLDVERLLFGYASWERFYRRATSEERNLNMHFSRMADSCEETFMRYVVIWSHSNEAIAVVN